ncbi:MAG TPA: Rieske (2Fe-2S) protein [Calditrichia bacterium]|nr:Rieske (2Fe-2S) protein [Calditrichota bacterium]HQU73256.1 Rieske (2Fe-2S) protein [Calditrichia bacterium]HQV33318.1 Rieske (2Fe-2S) protein [Calditrichia bacterium]
MAIAEISLGPAQAIPRGKRAVFDLPGGSQVLVLHHKKRWLAIENRCPHAGATLSEGLIKGPSLMCVWHGWTFDLESGVCRTHPETSLKFFPLRLVEGELWLQIETEDK